MNRIRKFAILAVLGLAACAPEYSASDVAPLESSKTPAVQLAKAGLSQTVAPAKGFDRFGIPKGDRSFHANIAFLETVLSYGPIADPRPIFLLANAYNVSNQQEYGIAFLERLLKRHERRMTADMHAVHLAAYAILRATHAEKVPLPGRLFWVLDTFDILEEAIALSAENPLPRWAAGIVYTQVPSLFGKREAAEEQLRWLLDRPEREPTPGFYREVYRHLAIIHEDRGEHDKAAAFLKTSGYGDYQPDNLFMGWFATSKAEGLRFAPTPWIEEIVKGRVFAVRGFGFSDLHFVVSDDGKALISIDAGTQPDSMKAGYAYLKQKVPDLPPLKAVLITHAHWDHVGGLSGLKSLGEKFTVYGRENYHGTIARVGREHSYHQFRGANFDAAGVRGYAPDVAIAKNTTLTIGGTRLDLIPVTGGETEDALLINLPELGVLFMGDALMPFYGEPWTEEGFIEDAIAMMDEALNLQPTHILHGHYGITIMYDAKQLPIYRDAYAWLTAQARTHLAKGYAVEDIIRMNLIPPGLQNHPEMFLGYLSPRDHVIARLGDHITGIWREDSSGQEPRGLDVLSSVEYGRLLSHYLELSQAEIATGLQRMLEGGDNELALQMAVAAEKRHPGNADFARLKRAAADRLRSAAQFFDPFKFTTYTEIMGIEHAGIPVRKNKVGTMATADTK